jgi:hypothetical protein
MCMIDVAPIFNSLFQVGSEAGGTTFSKLIYVFGISEHGCVHAITILINPRKPPSHPAPISLGGNLARLFRALQHAQHARLSALILYLRAHDQKSLGRSMRCNPTAGGEIFGR